MSPRIAALLPDELLSSTLGAPAYIFSHTHKKAAWCQVAGVKLLRCQFHAVPSGALCLGACWTRCPVYIFDTVSSGDALCCRPAS